MGEAILSSLLAKKMVGPEDIAVSDVSSQRRDFLKQKYCVFTTDSNMEAASRGTVIVLAIKPQNLDAVMGDLSGKLNESQLVLSIIAGRRIDTLRKGLQHNAIVRAMPNTPAQIGKGMTVWTSTEETTEDQEEDARAILNVMGHAIYTHDEKVLDMATAVSGSGPAYVFQFIEALIHGGTAIGLTPGLARTLAYQTVFGAAEYAYQSDKDLDTLIRMVASPGGTTNAALAVLEQGFFSEILRQAIEAAYERAKQLGG